MNEPQTNSESSPIPETTEIQTEPFNGGMMTTWTGPDGVQITRIVMDKMWDKPQ